MTAKLEPGKKAPAFDLPTDGEGRIKLSEYAIRLREKQKVRRIYGVLESQFRGYYHNASRRKGRTGSEMLGLLERRHVDGEAGPAADEIDLVDV